MKRASRARYDQRLARFLRHCEIEKVPIGVKADATTGVLSFYDTSERSFMDDDADPASLRRFAVLVVDDDEYTVYDFDTQKQMRAELCDITPWCFRFAIDLDTCHLFFADWKTTVKLGRPQKTA